MRSASGWVIQVATWLALLLTLSALMAAVLVPRIFGGTPYTVLTGSMEPGLPPGTLVVVRPVDPEQIRQGDVITYQLESGRSTTVTHRVVAIGTRLDGKRILTTQGDANDSPDPDPVRAVQVRGQLWYSVPYLGYANTILNGAQRQAAVYVASALLAGYAAVMLGGAVRDGRRTRHRASAGPPGHQPTETDGDYGKEDVHEDPTRSLISQRASGRAAFAALAVGIALGVCVLAARRSRATERARDA